MASEAENSFQPEISFPDADIILRSSDLMTFCLNKSVLREASQYFRSMFAIVPPDPEEIQILDVDVQGPSLLLLLQSQSLYNFTLAEPRPTVDEVLEHMQAAEKLEFDLAEEQLKHGLLITALANEPNPLRAWAIAKAHRLPEAADAAACRYFLSPDDFKAQWHSMPELANVNAIEFNALTHRRERAVNALRTEALNILWGWTCEECDERDEHQAYWELEQLELVDPHIAGSSIVESLLEDRHPAALGIDWILLALSLVELKTTCEKCRTSSESVKTSWEALNTEWWEDRMRTAMQEGLKPNTLSPHWQGI
ncbi:hypothetical protein DL93DRAFT_2095835 [Clavulina sp. PMI_390]|nr:hypothetical protein DL93DRAFT_2095835 [Clavulina sp. PMI_390]